MSQPANASSDYSGPGMLLSGAQVAECVCPKNEIDCLELAEVKPALAGVPDELLGIR